MKIEIPPQLVEFCQKNPLPVYMVGGFVRNRIAALPPSADIDIAGAFTAKEVAGSHPCIPVNKNLGTALIIFDGLKMEYTQFRREQYEVGGGHSPINVAFTDELKEDALRRDFTVNAIYYDVKNDLIIDPLGGVEDIKNKILRCENPDKIFASDGLRLLRLCRFAAELGFEIDPATLAAAQKNAQNLRDIAAERKRDELDKILLADQRYGVKNAHYRGLKLMHTIGLFKHVLPSLEGMEIEQNKKYHRYNALEHTLEAVKHSPAQIRLAALMHDTGKPVCQKLYGNMYGHDEESAKIVRRELGQNGLKYPEKTVQETERLVRLHMVDCDHKTGNGKMRLFVAKNFDIIEKLQMLAEADGIATGQTAPLKPRFLQFRQQLINENAPVTIKDLRIDGQDAIKAGLEGAQIKTTLYSLWEQCVLNPKLNNREWLLAHLNPKTKKNP